MTASPLVVSRIVALTCAVLSPSAGRLDALIDASTVTPFNGIVTSSL